MSRNYTICCRQKLLIFRKKNNNFVLFWELNLDMKKYINPFHAPHKTRIKILQKLKNYFCPNMAINKKILTEILREDAPNRLNKLTHFGYRFFSQEIPRFWYLLTWKCKILWKKVVFVSTCITLDKERFLESRCRLSLRVKVTKCTVLAQTRLPAPVLRFFLTLERPVFY